MRCRWVSAWEQRINCVAKTGFRAADQIFQLLAIRCLAVSGGILRIERLAGLGTSTLGKSAQIIEATKAIPPGRLEFWRLLHRLIISPIAIDNSKVLTAPYNRRQCPLRNTYSSVWRPRWRIRRPPIRNR